MEPLTHTKNRVHEKIAWYAAGFTLIEIMIAVAIFTIVMTIGVGAVINANTIHKVNQSQRALMDNLNFVMEDMSRNIRLGAQYYCFDAPPYDMNAFPLDPDTGFGPTRDCTEGRSAIGFEPMEGDPTAMNDQVVYMVAADAANTSSCSANNPCKIWKSVDGGQNFVDITPANIIIDPFRTGFTVVGAGTPLDFTQPAVIIRLAGEIHYKTVVTPFVIETTVTERATDS